MERWLGLGVLLMSLALAPPSASAEELERYILSFGSGIGVYVLENDKLKLESRITRVPDWHYEIYPNHRRSKNTVIFDGEYSPHALKRWIFEAPIEPNGGAKAIPIVEGGLPSLSPDDRHLAYVARYQLKILDLETGETRGPIAKLPGYGFPVWADPKTLLYYLKETGPVSYDLETGRSRIWDLPGILPVKKIPGRPEVICYEDGALVVLDIETKATKKLASAPILGIAGPVVLRPDNRGFLYSRSTWKNMLRLKLIEGTFARDWDGNETEIRDIGLLFGGFPIGGDTGEP